MMSSTHEPSLTISVDLQHHLFSLTLKGKLHLAPIGEDRPIQRVLDAGTGTGVWAIDFGMRRSPSPSPNNISSHHSLLTRTKADAHPETEVIGIDISPIQPTLYARPPPPSLSSTYSLLVAFPPTFNSKSTTLKTSGPLATSSILSTPACSLAQSVTGPSS